MLRGPSNAAADPASPAAASAAVPAACHHCCHCCSSARVAYFQQTQVEEMCAKPEATALAYMQVRRSAAPAPHTLLALRVCMPPRHG